MFKNVKYNIIHFKAGASNTIMINSTLYTRYLNTSTPVALWSNFEIFFSKFCAETGNKKFVSQQIGVYHAICEFL